MGSDYWFIVSVFCFGFFSGGLVRGCLILGLRGGNKDCQNGQYCANGPLPVNEPEVKHRV